MRSGVRTRPWRSGSSPRRTSNSRNNSCVLAEVNVDCSYSFFTAAPVFTRLSLCSNLPASSVFERIQHSFFHADLLDLRLAEPSLQDVVQLDAKILRSRHGPLKFGEGIQVLVPEAFDDLPVYEFI